MTDRAGAGLRAALLAGCALSVLGAGSNAALAMGGTPVPVGCVVTDGADNVLNCSGNLSAGVPFAILVPFPGLPPIYMNVFDVTTDITPSKAPGIAVSFTGGDVIINSDLGSRRIVTRNSLPGIYAAGRNVTINHQGDIVAEGFAAYGILAQAEDCECVIEDPDFPPDSPSSKPAVFETVTLVSKADITVDSFGAGILAAGGQGVSVTSTGNIRAGYGSNGIVALNGGEGSQFGIFAPGDVTVVSTGDITLDNRGPRAAPGAPEFKGLGDFAFPFQAGIFAANAGMGSVNVVSKGNIETVGNFRHGIFANSSGFGVNEAVSVNSTGNVATTGRASFGIFGSSLYADVSIESKGNINTRGALADGIHGESELGGTVSITSTGDINATGDGAFGIFAAGYNNLSITVQGGTVSGGSGDGGSIGFFAGANNKLVNRGTITAGKSGWAVEGDMLGSETIENYGTISGNVELNLEPSEDWSGIQVTKIAQPVVTTDAFNNRAGATFNSGKFVELGNAGLLRNEGTLNPGGTGVAADTFVDGRLQQTRTGVLGIDIDGQRADYIEVEPATSTSLPLVVLAGKVVPNIVSFDTSSRRQKYEIVWTNGEVVNNGLTVADTALVDYELLFPFSNNVVLSMEVDFNISGLTPNQGALLSYLGRLIGSDGADQFDDIFVAYLSAPDRDSIAQLAGQMLTGVGNSALTAMFVGEAFGNAMRSCAVAGGEFSQQRETSCLWAKPFAREFSQNAGTDRANIDSNSAGFAGGMQTQLSEKVFVGGGFSIEETNAALDFTSRQEGTWWQFGGVLKYVDGPLKLSASVNGGQGDLDNTRQAGLVPGVTAESGTDVTFVTNMARLAYSFGSSGFYVTPMLDGGATYVDMDGFTESGAGALNLAVSSSDQWIFFGGPAVEVGATIAQGGFEFRPYIKAGVTFLSEDSFDVDARFAAASTSVAPFRVTSNLDDTFATLDAGVQLFSADGINLRLNYQGRFGEDSRENGVDAKLSINY